MPITERETRSDEGVLPPLDREFDVILCSNSIYKVPVPAMRMPPADMVAEFSIFTTGRSVNMLSMRQPTTHDATRALFCVRNCLP